MYDCKLCGKKVVRDDGGKLWLTAGHFRGVTSLERYCWVDQVHGSQLHDVDLPGEKEIWLVATFRGEEVARLYVAEFLDDEELDLFNRNGSMKKDLLAQICPRGSVFQYIKVSKTETKILKVESED